MPKQQQNLKSFFSSKRSVGSGSDVATPEEVPAEDIENGTLEGNGKIDEPQTMDRVSESVHPVGSTSSRPPLLHSGPTYSIFAKNAPPPPMATEPARGRKRKAEGKPSKAPRKSSKSIGKSQPGAGDALEPTDPPPDSARETVQTKGLVGPILNLLRVPGTSSRPLSRASSRSSQKGSAISEPIVIEDDDDPMDKLDEPITVDDSPVIQKGPPPPTHPFFASRPTTVPLTTLRGNGVASRMRVALLPPWPDAESQHVGGSRPNSSSVTLAGGRRTLFKRRRLNPRPSQLLGYFDYTSLARDLTRPRPSSPAPVQSDEEETESPIFRAHLRHPALARLVGPIDDQHSELWCEKYRPLRATEVLGNEAHAIYLKDWLRALELRVTDDSPQPDGIDGPRPSFNGEKKRNIIRTVDKSQRRKRKRKIDDWIVSDDELSGTEWPEDPVEDWSAADDGTMSDHGSTASSAGPPPFLTTPRQTRHLPVHDFSQRLTNAILLSGPPGSGKTAAVYACAHDLGWEVFEVYPGIGKRSGAGLMTLVGEVGRNHLVRKAPVTGKVTFEKLLFAGNKSAGYQLSSGTQEQPISVDSSSPPDTGPAFMETLASSGTNGTAAQVRLPTPEATGVRQSVILLEEVDVLFREDAGFWQAVIALVKDSHRPVIMTCNDPTLVPIEDLPVQEHLRFEPAEAELQISYLQRIGWVEGHNFPRKVLSGIREGSSDLRQAINSLQWTCSGKHDLKSLRQNRSLSPTFEKDLKEASPGLVTRLDRYASFLDYRSFVDAYLTRPESRTIQALEPDRSESSLDDEQGHVAVQKPNPADTDVGIAAYLHDEVFADEVDATAISRFSHFIPPLESKPAAESACMTSLLTYLAPLIPISSYLLPHPAVIVDYAPYVRAMVHADDEGAEADAAREAARFSRAGRPLRLAAAKFNARLPYARWISLDELALAEARRGTLGF